MIANSIAICKSSCSGARSCSVAGCVDLMEEFGVAVTVSYLKKKAPVARDLFALSTCTLPGEGSLVAVIVLRCIFQTRRPTSAKALVRFEADSGEFCWNSGRFLDLAFHCNPCQVK